MSVAASATPVRRLLLAVVALWFLGCTGALAAPSTGGPAAPAPLRAAELSSAITFDDLPVGTEVTDQYAGAGVVFSEGAFTSNDTSTSDAPVLSGYPRFRGDVVGSFVVPGTTTPTTVGGFRMTVGYINNRDSVEVSYYAADGSLQGAVRANEYGHNTITVSRNGIASFRVRAVEVEAAGFAIDNLSIGSSVAASSVARMVSLGDSYSSGEGLLPEGDLRYFCGTDMHRGRYYKNTTVPYLTLKTSRDCDPTTGAKLPNSIYFRGWADYANLCHRAPTAYPNLIRQRLGVRDEDSAFIACSGATMGNIAAPGVDGLIRTQYPLSPFGVYGGEAQYKNLADFAGRRGSPDLITIGIGGNDIGFGPIVQACLKNNCLDDAVVTSVQSKLDGEVRKNLVATLSALRRDYPAAKIAAFGYPSVVDPAVPACKGLDFSPTQQGIDDAERRYMADTLLPALNRTIADAAAEAGVTFIDITAVTRGHEICTPDSWINGLQGGDDALLGTVANESFHPNQKAHRAIADYFIANYTDGQGHIVFSNPEPQKPIAPTPGAITWRFGNLQTDTQSACGANCLQPACTVNCRFVLQGQGFAPGMSLSVTAHSDPVSLGSVPVGADGTFDVALAAPPSLPAGQHLIEVRGAGPDGTTYYSASTVRVVRKAVVTRAPGVLAVKVRPWRKKALRVTLRCPKGAPATCRATLALARGPKGRAPLSKKVAVRRGTALTVILAATTRRSTALPGRRSHLRVTQKVLGTRTFVVPRQRGR